MITFHFYFYALPSLYGHPTRIRRGLRASDGPDGPYARSFHALALAISHENAAQTVSSVAKVEHGLSPVYQFGADGWNIEVTQERVNFTNDDYGELSGPGVGAFPLAEFKWILMAWWEFLLLPEQPAGMQYKFALPDDQPCLLERPGGLLELVRGDAGRD